MRRFVQAVAVAGALLLASPAVCEPADISSRPVEHPAPGTTLRRFARVDTGIYRGSPPRSKADFEFLRSRGVHYIVNLQFWPFLYFREKKAAREHGMVYISVFIPGSPVQPSEKNVNRALALLRQYRSQGVYVHCILGRDRSSLVAALYKMYFLGESQKNAWQNDFMEFGYKDTWLVRGLKKYFYDHPKAPPALLKHSHRASSEIRAGEGIEFVLPPPGPCATSSACRDSTTRAILRVPDFSALH